MLTAFVLCSDYSVFYFLLAFITCAEFRLPTLTVGKQVLERLFPDAVFSAPHEQSLCDRGYYHHIHLLNLPVIVIHF